jgi:hypothetical protein
VADSTPAPAPAPESPPAAHDEDAALVARLESQAGQMQQRVAQVREVVEVAPSQVAKEAWWTPRSAMTMCSMVLAFGFIVIVISSWLAMKKVDKDAILKVVTIPMAVMLAVFLVVAGYSDSQIAPAMGLLGTIVGYVLGTARNVERPAQSGDAKP